MTLLGFSRLRFRTKINLGIASIVLCIALPLAVAVSRMAADALIDESKKRGSVLVQNLAVRVEDPMLAMDLLRLKNMVDELAAVEDIEYAFVLDAADNVLVHSFPSAYFPVELKTVNRVADEVPLGIELLRTEDERLIYDFAAPVMISRTRFGTVRMGLSRSQTQAVVNRLVLVIFGLSGVALVSGFVFSTVFARRVTRRLNILREHAEEMVKGNLDLQTGPSLTRNCWEMLDCRLTNCPAFGDSRRRCWYLAGTMCPECDNSSPRGKLESCKNCLVYQMNKGDEIQDLAETFDVMALALKAHIGELKQAERNLTRQQSLMRTILEVTPDMVGLLDTNLKYLAANKALAAFFGRDVAEVVGSQDTALYPPAEAERAAAEHRENEEVLASGPAVSKETEWRRGERRHFFHVVKLPARDRDGHIMGLLFTARDIGEVKKYQEQLIQSQKMESVGKLAGGVAHEINTPLGVILGYAQLLQEDVPADSQILSDLKTIEKQAKVCRKIVADLLKFSRQSESEKREMCFNNSLMEAVSLVKHTFSLDKIEIKTEMDDRMPIIFGDPDKLKQVWLNLLNNARDAMDGGGAILVRTRLDSPAKKVTAWVADTGPGIDAEHLGHIFEPFFSTKPVGKGTGLGLSVSFGIIQDHKGSIRVQSPVPAGFMAAPRREGAAPGPGALFIVDLPLDHEVDVDAAAD